MNNYEYETCLHEAGHLFVAYLLNFDIHSVRINIKKLFAQSKIINPEIKSFKAAMVIAGWMVEKIISGHKISFEKSYFASEDYKVFRYLKFSKYKETKIKRIVSEIVKKHRSEIIRLAKFIHSRKRVNLILVKGDEIKNNIKNSKINLNSSFIINVRFDLLKMSYNMNFAPL